MSWFHTSAGQLVHFKSEGGLLVVMSDQVLVEHVSFTFDIELGSLVDVRASHLTTRPCARIRRKTQLLRVPR